MAYGNSNYYENVSAAPSLAITVLRCRGYAILQGAVVIRHQRQLAGSQP